MSSPPTTAPPTSRSPYLEIVELDWSDRLFVLASAIILVVLPAALIAWRGVSLRLVDVTTRDATGTDRPAQDD